MKPFYFNIIAAILLNVNNLNSQIVTPQNPYEKIIFEDVEPLWYVTYQDSSFTDYGSDGINCFSNFGMVEKLIYKNFCFYINHNRISYDGHLANYYVSCFNLDNGNLVWRQKIKYAENPNIEVPRIIKIDEEENLVLIGKKLSVPYDNTKSHHENLILFERKYKALSGEFVSLRHQPLDDPNVARMYYNYYEESLFFEEGDNIRSMEWRVVDGKQAIVGFLMDRDGVLVREPDTIIYHYTNNVVNGYNLTRISDDSVMLVEVGVNDSLETMIILRFFNNDLEFNYERRIFVDIPVNLPLIRLIGISPDKKKILVSIRQPPIQEHPNGYVINMVLHLDGYIVKNLKKDFNVTVFFDWWDEREGIVFSKFYENDPGIQSATIKLVHEFGEFQNEILKEHKILNKFAYALPSDYFEYQGKDIVVFSEGAFYFNNVINDVRIDDFASAISIMAFEKGDFLPVDIYSSTKEEIFVEKICARIYPNPSTGNFTVDLEEESTTACQLEIFDVTGQKVFESQDIHFGKNTFDLSYLKSGMYIYSLCGSQNSCYKNKWVKVE